MIFSAEVAPLDVTNATMKINVQYVILGGILTLLSLSRYLIVTLINGLIEILLYVFLNASLDTSQ